jgi:hypothetical protein
MEFLGVLIHLFIYVWITIIAFIPNFFMGGLTVCILGTLLTYLERREAN